MRKKGDYYNFTGYTNYRNNNNYRHYKNNVNRIKLIATLFIIIITIILIIISANIEANIKASDESASEAIKQSQIEEEKAKEEEEKAKAEEERLRKEKEEREAKLPKLTEIGIENMDNIYHSETKRAFLTFDDGPSNITPQILDTLKAEDVKATFFMLGCNVVNFPETTKRVWDEGHYIANHGYTHVYSSIYSSPQAVLDEYNRCNDAVKNALGEPEYNSHLFRFPGGMPGGKYASIKKEAKQLLSDNGVLAVDWNALTGDAESQNPVEENLMQKLQETTEEKNSVVILMHDAQAKKVTADMLPRTIAYLREQGYEFKTFYDIIK